MHLERPNRILIVGSGDNDEWPARAWKRIEELETIQAWHLNIEKAEVRAQRLDSGNRRNPIGGFPHNLYLIGMPRQQSSQPRSGVGLVVHNDSPSLQCETSWPVTGEVVALTPSTGRTRVARVPLGSRASITSSAPAP